MGKYIYDENNRLWYERKGDYCLPCLTLPAEEKETIGIWGKDICSILKPNKKHYKSDIFVSFAIDSTSQA